MITNLELEKTDVLEALLVLQLTLSEGILQDLDLLIEQGKLIVTSDELGTENITLVDRLNLFLLAAVDLFGHLVNDVFELEDLLAELLALLSLRVVLVLPVKLLVFALLNLLLAHGIETDLSRKSLLSRLVLGLELTDLMLSDEEAFL